ncbi:MAG TPA: 4'-phosphopantetheinyl transferase superfamily protein [Streptosporangiaceae bacterium]|jgi:4'-phosphopantetheinyl transferase EntD
MIVEPVIAEILPPPVAAVEAFEDPPGATLFPEEEAAMARAVPRRRGEFAAGRACARAALAQLGLPAAPILPGPRGAPQWPPGVVGTITHCDGYRASAVAHARDVLTLGLDAEPDGPLPGGVLDAVSLAEERDRLPGLAAAAPHVPWDRLLFCAKEAVYKAWFPLAGRWLGFEEAAITFAPDAGTFTARLLVPGPAVGGRPLDGFSGRWLARGGLLLAAIAVPA